jgi:SAM-dependent methyltransferase
VKQGTAGERGDEIPWYERWFGAEYLDVYPHRDETEAIEAVRLLLEGIPLQPGARVLDLACGAGRHLRSMHGRGFSAIGLDLSFPLLRRAKEANSTEKLVRGDMRSLPFGKASFDSVASFFTSFGYFNDDNDNERVISEIRRVLRPEGYLLLDFLNAQRVKETLSPRDEGELDGRRMIQERRLVEGGRAVEKTIHLDGAGTGGAEVFRERVRLYSPDELAELLGGQGLEPERWFGSYAGEPLTPSAPRVIVVARAS